MRNLSLLLTVLAITAPLASQAQEPALSTMPPARQSQEPAMAKEFRIDSDASWIRVLAGPDGPLKRFGHYHVISHQALSGSVTVAPNPLESQIMLEVNVNDFEVDNPELRKEEGEDFAKEVSQKDIDGTRGNMLGEKLLNAEQFPTIRIRSTAIEGELPDVNVVATVIVKGMEQTVSFPANIDLRDDSFVASGELELLHEALGLSPFTAMGGALSVRDMMVFKYEISGVLVTDDD